MFGSEIMIVTDNYRIVVWMKYVDEITVPMKLAKDGKDVIIENACWKGVWPIILKKVMIVMESIITAYDVVLKDFPRYISSSKDKIKPYSDKC